MPIKLSAAAIIEREGNILLVEEGDDPGMFGLPGGGPKKRELLDECIVREVREESGLEVSLDSPNGLVGIYQCPRTRAGNNLTRFVFACTVIGGRLTASDKHPTVDYYPIEEIAKLDQAGQLRNNGVLRAIQDYHAGQRYSLGTLTYLDKEPKLTM